MKRPVFCLSTVCAVFIFWTLFSVPWCSSYPLEGGTDSPQLRFVEEFDRFKLGFSWHNMSCAVCKAIFATLDIALLVRQAFTSFSYCLLNCPGFPVYINVALFCRVKRKLDTVSFAQLEPVTKLEQPDSIFWHHRRVRAECAQKCCHSRLRHINIHLAVTQTIILKYPCLSIYKMKRMLFIHVYFYCNI